MLMGVALNFVFILVLYLDSSNVSAKKIRVKKARPEDEMIGKIIGGKAIPLERVPYSVQLFNMGAMCAGTILNSWTILTAAHCFDANRDPGEMVVQIGSRFVYDFNANQYDVADVVVHKKYNQTGLFACDIAILFLDRRIKFTKKSMKTVLVNNKKWMNPKETGFTVTGWGLTKYGGQISKQGLMMTELQFVPKKKCSKLHNIKMSADMFCLYGNGRRDTCKGDSGGGVFWKGMMVGITSHGDGCAKKQKPSVYTNVEYFRTWIHKEILGYVKKYCKNLSKSKKYDSDYV